MKHLLDWSLPDQLAYSAVSSLLKLATAHSECRERIMSAISTFTFVLVNKLRECSGEY
jgi:hypothetical protein